MLVELSEAQLGLLKACTSAQKQLLRDNAKDYPAESEACHEQMRECTDLHELLTDAQFAFIRARRDAAICF